MKIAGFTTGQSGTSVHVEVPMGDHTHQVDIMVVANAETASKFHTHNIPGTVQSRSSVPGVLSVFSFSEWLGVLRSGTLLSFAHFLPPSLRGVFAVSNAASRLQATRLSAPDVPLFDESNRLGRLAQVLW